LGEASANIQSDSIFLMFGEASAYIQGDSLF